LDNATPAAIYRLFQNLIATFEAENPGVKVNWVDVPWSAMETKILTAVSANGTGRRPEPDLPPS